MSFCAACGLIVPLIGLLLEIFVGYGKSQYGFLWDWYRKLHPLFPSGILLMSTAGAEGTVGAYVIFTVAAAANMLIYALLSVPLWLVGRGAAGAVGILTRHVRGSGRNGPDAEMQPKRSKWVPGAFLGLPTLVILASSMWLDHDVGVGRPVRFELPVGYRGWVEVEYGNPQCSRLTSRGLFLIVSVPKSGRSCTSNALGAYFAIRRYEFVGVDGQRTAILVEPPLDQPGIRNEGANADRREEYFFVGTQQEWMEWATKKK